MTDYSELSLEELQKLLVEKNMPTEGSREELIERLNSEKLTSTGDNAVHETSTDAASATTEKEGELQSKETLNESGEATHTTAATATATPINSQGTEAKNGTTSSAELEKSQSPPLTKEEITKLALDLLNKKLHRANKFGMDQSEIDAINQQINRVNKFGVNLQSPLALELGLVKPVKKLKNTTRRDSSRGNGISKSTQRDSSRSRHRSRYRNRNRGGYDDRVNSRKLRY